MKTYVVRLAEPPGPDQDGPWPVRGVVDEIATGRRTPFRDSAELIALLDGSEPDPQPCGPHTGSTPDRNHG